jgi:hypothetical protein
VATVGDCPPGVVVAVFGMGWRRLPGVATVGDCPPGVVVAVFGMGWRRPPGDVTVGDCPPPGTVVAKLFRGGSVAGLPSVAAPVSAAARIGGGGGAAGSGAFSAPLLTRVTTALGNAALTGAALPPIR